MILYGSSMSPFVRKVLAFAAEQGTELELKPMGLGSTDPDFLRASPFRKMPALTDGDFAISDSSAIIHYLDALHPEAKLIPTEPRARARTIWFDEFGDRCCAQPAGRCFSIASCRRVFLAVRAIMQWPMLPKTTSCRPCSIISKASFPRPASWSRIG